MSDEEENFGSVTRSKDKKGRNVARRNTTVMQDLHDIGRMVTGGRGGRQRSQAIDDEVDEAVNGRRRGY
jgi:hypothetical protein